MGSRARHRHRDRPDVRAAARDRHDALRDHAVGIAGAHAAGGRARAAKHEVFAVFEKWGLDAVTIGAVTDDGMLRVKDHGEVVAEIPNRALADEAPLYDRPHGVAPYRPAPMEGPAMPVGARSRRTICWRLLASPISARSAGSGSSTTTWCAPTRWQGPAAMRPSCASRKRARRLRCRWTATGATAALRPARRHEADCGGVLPESGDGRRAAGGRDQQPELRQSRAAGDHGAACGVD